MTGTKDFNLEDTTQVHSAYTAAHFDGCKLQVVPEMGHGNPDGPNWAAALAFLDEPLQKKAETLLKQGRAAEGRGKLEDAFALYNQAAGYGNADAQAKVAEAQQAVAEQMKAADALLAASGRPGAYQRYQAIVSRFGPALAAAAVVKIREMEADPTLKAEIQAADYLGRIEQAMAGGKATPEQIRGGLQKVIDGCPGTGTAKRAQGLMDSLK